MAVGFCYAVPEELADGAWNMLAIAVCPQKRGGGVAALSPSIWKSSLGDADSAS